MAGNRRMLEGLDWNPSWISHIGCQHACVEYLGLDLSMPWIHGGTGHAFVVNIHDELCPSGPTAWNTEHLDRLAANLGYLVEGVTGRNSERDFEARQKIAWALVTGCIDTDVPCYGWEFAMPEWYVITGYDDDGYYFAGPCAEDYPSPLERDRLGCTELGYLSVHCVLPCEPSPDEEIVCEAIGFALDHARGDYAFEGYCAGPEAFERWAIALESGRANRFGAGYNAECWHECRGMAVEFLREAKLRLDREQTLLDEAIRDYSAVRDGLARIIQRHPFEFSDHIPEDETLRSPECASILRRAKRAEERALDALARLGDALQS